MVESCAIFISFREIFLFLYINLDFAFSELLFVFGRCVLIRKGYSNPMLAGTWVSGAQFGIAKPTLDSLAQADSSAHPCSQVLFGFYSTGRLTLTHDFTFYLLPHCKSIQLALPFGKSATSKQPCGYVVWGIRQKGKCGSPSHIHPLSPGSPIVLRGTADLKCQGVMVNREVCDLSWRWWERWKNPRISRSNT